MCGILFLLNLQFLQDGDNKSRYRDGAMNLELFSDLAESILEHWDSNKFNMNLLKSNIQITLQNFYILNTFLYI